MREPYTEIIDLIVRATELAKFDEAHMLVFLPENASLEAVDLGEQIQVMKLRCQ